MDRSVQVHARENGGNFRYNLPKLIIISVVIIITLSLLIFTIILIQYSSFWSHASDSLSDDLIFVKRVEWEAQPPDGFMKKLNITPVPYVIISHSASEPCYTRTECNHRARLAQMMHMEINKRTDIGFNFLIGGNGLVYVGRGWDIEGAHSFGYNRESIGICMIGRFHKIMPTTEQLQALNKLIALGVKENKIRDDYKLLGQHQVSVTLSPGRELYKLIQNMDHWSETP